MNDHAPSRREVFHNLIKKGTLKQAVFNKTHTAFNHFKQEADTLVLTYRSTPRNQNYPVPFDFHDRGQFEFQLNFAGDTLIFMMHTNVFEFSRDHEVKRTSYIKENPKRSYCGVIYIFNFLADSFRYNRLNDIGYMIGRIFVNYENHYFVEGKREIGLLYPNFAHALLNRKAIRGIIQSAMLYTINFDLLTPSYDTMKEVTVREIQAELDAMQMKTGKRMGFRFDADNI